MRLDGFEPVLGNTFTIVTTGVGNVSGQLDAELLPIFNGLTFNVIYNPKSVFLQAVEAALLLGDYKLWRQRFGNAVPGVDSGNASANAATPEPTTIVLALIDLAGFSLFCMRRRVTRLSGRGSHRVAVRK